MSDDPFQPPPDTSARSGAAGNSSGLPPVGELLSALVAEVQKDFASFLVAGVGTLIIAFLSVPLALVAVYGGMFLGMVPGLAMDDEGITAIGSIAGMMGGMFVMFGGILLLAAPMSASMFRAVWRWMTTGEKLTIMAPFSTFTQDIVRVLVFSFVQFGLVMLGAMFCYVPGLIVAALLVFAGPAICIHRLPIGPAVSLSVAHVRDHFSWHLGFFLVAFLMQMVLAYVPLVGPMLLATLLPLYILMGYRHAFGDGPTPRGVDVEIV